MNNVPSPTAKLGLVRVGETGQFHLILQEQDPEKSTEVRAAIAKLLGVSLKPTESLKDAGVEYLGIGSLTLGFYLDSDWTPSLADALAFASALESEKDAFANEIKALNATIGHLMQPPKVGYLHRLLEAERRNPRVFQEIGTSIARTAHDDWCESHKGGECDCIPEITLHGPAGDFMVGHNGLCYPISPKGEG